MQLHDFTYIRELLRERTAVVLREDKNYLVESCLAPLVYQYGFESLTELVAQLRAVPYSSLHQCVVEAMTNNETSFFRDLHPFEALTHTILPTLMDKRAASRTLNIWCAACSSGQEPYSIAMILREHVAEPERWTLNVIASDVSEAMLRRAKAGCYSQHEVNRGLPVGLLLKYFDKEGHDWQITDELRRMVKFHMINLAGLWPVLPDMDLIFLRNVMIYFDVETKKTILRKVQRLLKSDGYLFLGSAETTAGLDNAFEWVDLKAASCHQLLHQEEQTPCHLPMKLSVK